ncbi:hypothetical protein [Paraburkholderia sp. JHI869]|uniref:hypothetical protein n=1 Tax=Paraburkholderia sp. JHI869 TaxID=3112959 RepID=UPI00317CA52D
MIEMSNTADQIETALRRWCRENGHPVSPLDEVSEPIAAKLLNVSPSCLRRQFDEGRSMVPVARLVLDRRMYAISALAAYLAHGAHRALDL